MRYCYVSVIFHNDSYSRLLNFGNYAKIGYKYCGYCINYFNIRIYIDTSDNGSMVFRIGSLFILDSDMEVVMPVIAFNTESANYSQKIK